MARPDQLLSKRRKLAPDGKFERVRERERPARAASDDSDMSGEEGPHLNDDDAQNAQESEPQELSNNSDDSSDESMADDDEGLPDEDDQRAMRNISFGALAKAQDDLAAEALPTPQAPAADKLQALRDRLAELRSAKRPSKPSKKSKPSRANDDNSSASDSNGEQGHRRTSKHAPAEQSSKHQVTRRRAVVATAGHAIPSGGGDPRFSVAAGRVDADRVAKNYAFLDDYAARELADLKTSLAQGAARRGKAAMPADEQEGLRREIGRRENRARAAQRKERERDLLRQHKKAEREKVREGKTPFYLKKGEVKKQVDKDLWDGMKAKDRDKAEQRRQKRKEAKELRNKPAERRSRV